MTFFYGYLLFAFTTAVVAVYELLWPLKQMISKGKIIDNWYATNVAFFCIALLVAPFIILPCLIPGMGDRFRMALVKELQVDE